MDTPLQRRAAIAATFAASLELARNGTVDLRQEGAFAPIYLRKRDEAALAAINSSTAMPRATE